MHLRLLQSMSSSQATLPSPSISPHLAHFTHISLLPLRHIFSHLTLHVLRHLTQLILGDALLHRPSDPQPFLLVRLRNHVEMYVVYHLVCCASVVLENIIVGCSGRCSQLLRDGQDLGERVVGDVCQFCAVVFRDD